MKVEYINPFVESVFNLFETMLKTEVKRGEVGLVKGGGATREITAFIGLSGKVCGTVALSFPTKTALDIISKFMGQEIHVVDQTVTDGIAEIVNIVAGGAKVKLSGDGPPVSLSLATVVRGNSYSVDYPSKCIWLEIPFESSLGAFTLRVTLESNNDHQGGE